MAVPDTQQEVLVRALRVGLRIALGVLGDREAAAEVAQEVAIVAFQRHGSLRDPIALDSWLYKTAVRAALREAERSRTRREAEHAAAVPDPPRRRRARGRAAARGASPRQRAALTLRYVHDLDDHAIATALGCRRGTVRSLLARAFDAPRAGRPRRQDDLMSDDLQTLLRPLRELEPTSDEVARVPRHDRRRSGGDVRLRRPLLRSPAAGGAGRRFARDRRGRAVLPAGKGRSLRGALRAAAAAAAEAPAPRRSPATGTSSSASAKRGPARHRASSSTKLDRRAVARRRAQRTAGRRRAADHDGRSAGRRSPSCRQSPTRCCARSTPPMTTAARGARRRVEAAAEARRARPPS